MCVRTNSFMRINEGLVPKHDASYCSSYAEQRGRASVPYNYIMIYDIMILYVILTRALFPCTQCTHLHLRSSESDQQTVPAI